MSGEWVVRTAAIGVVVMMVQAMTTIGYNNTINRISGDVNGTSALCLHDDHHQYYYDVLYG